MKASIQTKLLALCILLILLTTVSISVAYYVLATQDKQRESQQRIQVAFDMILDDLADRLHIYPNRVDEFLSNNETLRVATASYLQDPTRISSISFLSTNLAKTAEELKRFGHVISADRLTLYGSDMRLLTAYQRDDNQETVGIYGVLAEEKDTYLPLDDPSQLTPMLLGRQPIPDTSFPPGVSASYDKDIPDAISTNLFTEGGRLGIKITAPVYDQDTITGILIVDIFYTQSIVKRYASISGTDVNFFARDQFSIGTLRTQAELEPAAIKQIISCEDIMTNDLRIDVFPVTFDTQEYYQGRCAFRAAQDTIGAISVSLSQDIEKKAIRKILMTILTISGIVTGVAFGLSVLFSRKTIHSIQNIVRVIAAAAEGDLRRTTIVMTRDEIGMLATKLNQMIAQLRGISGRVQDASHAVNSTADAILRQMESLIQHMEQQSASVDNTTESIHMIKQFIDVVARNTNDLLVAAAYILSSIQETRASINEVTTSTGSLTTNLLLISSAVDQVNQSVKQIGENTGHLEEVTKQTETEIHHIDQSLRDVSHNADRTQQLAKETMDAATSGQTSVEASIQGMTELKEVVSNTDQIIREVNTWGERVSSILDVVDDITEQTSLLALNASIISAQAGAHGRGFGVVADEIKELATRTKVSTKEIGTLIRELRMKTEEGVNNTAEGLKKADQGMQLANAVKDALHTILESATRSLNRAADTARVTQQTAASSQAINAQMNKVTDMVSTIKTAIQGERQNIEQVVSAVENISGMSEQVNRASLEQKKNAEEIERNMEEVTEQFSKIAEQTETLQQNSDQIVAAMHTIDSTTEQILQNASYISGETVKNLLQQSNMLQKIVNVFKVS